MSWRFRNLTLILIFFLVISACGKKEFPTLKGYTPPPVVNGLSAQQRIDYVLLEWSYPKEKKNVDFVIDRKRGEEDFERTSVQPGKSYREPIEYGETYIYRVYARSESGILSKAAEITFPALAPPPPPATVSFIIQNDKVKLSWEYERTDVLFNIYKEDGKTGLITGKPIAEHSFEVPAEPNTTVSFEVRTLLGGPFVYEGEGTKAVIAPQDFVPVKPSGLKAVGIEEGVRLIWNENPEIWVKGYVIYREINGELQKIGQSSIPSFLDPGSKGGTYRISALGPLSEGQLSDPVSL